MTIKPQHRPQAMWQAALRLIPASVMPGERRWYGDRSLSVYIFVSDTKTIPRTPYADDD